MRNKDLPMTAYVAVHGSTSPFTAGVIQASTSVFFPSSQVIRSHYDRETGTFSLLFSYPLFSDSIPQETRWMECLDHNPHGKLAVAVQYDFERVDTRHYKKRYGNVPDHIAVQRMRRHGYF